MRGQEPFELVSAMLGHAEDSDAGLAAWREVWERVDHTKAAGLLTLLLSMMIEREAERRGQEWSDVLNQMIADIEGDRAAREMGIDPDR